MIEWHELELFSELVRNAYELTPGSEYEKFGEFNSFDSFEFAELNEFRNLQSS